MNKIIFLLLQVSFFVQSSFLPLKLIQEQQKRCFFAAAYGDALGRVTEFIKSVDKIFEKYPHGVTSFDDFTESDIDNIPESYKFESAWQVANTMPYTDDTAMAIIVYQELYYAKKNNLDLDCTMSNIAKEFIFDMHRPHGWDAWYRAPGLCCKKYVHELERKLVNNKTKQTNWWRVSPANGKTGGCGSVMRAYPFGLVFYDNPEQAKVWAAEHSELTHGDYSAKAACAAIAIGVAYALNNMNKEFIIDAMIDAAQQYDQTTADKMKAAYQNALEARELFDPNFSVIEQLMNPTDPFRQQHDKFFDTYLGWSAQDAIACVVYIFTLFTNDTLSAIYTGIHTPGDSDSIASLAGALVGAYDKNFDYKSQKLDRLESHRWLANHLVS